MPQTNRRTFLTAGAAALSIGKSRILGANDRVRVGIIGLGGRGGNHFTEYLKLPGAEVAGLCDVNQAARERFQAALTRENRAKAAEYEDMRKMFEDKSIDSVSMATPNHWHSLGAVWAVQAGKDVYVEKPASHDIWEGHKMIEAARKYKRIMQVGHQSRSIPHKIEAMQLLHEGAIGKIYMAKALCYKRRKSIGRTPNEPVPAGINWDMFLGPAPMRPFSQNRFKYNWHWFWDTGNGDIGNQGVHEMDIMRWGCGLPSDKHTGLKSVVSTGGKYVYDDDQETPNTQLATFDYGDKQLVFEVRGIITNGEGSFQGSGNIVGNLFYGADGVLELDGRGYKIFTGEDRKLVREGAASKGESETGRHMQNFLDAVKSRDHTQLRADIEIAAASADFCHLANIAYRTGRKLNWDAAAGRFINDSEANRMLTRDYRRPYVVPERV
jgi:predicted dehydrogenase